MRLGVKYLLGGCFLCYMLVSCVSEHHSNQLLGSVDSMLSSDPHGALRLLKTENPSSLSSEEDLAYYALLMVQATDKSELKLLPCDSLVDVALRYYDKGINRAKALFYKGRILSDMGLSKDAIGYYFKALPECGMDYTGVRLKGMIHEDLGGIYFDQSLYNEALSHFDSALAFYASINDKKAMTNVLSFMNSVYAVKSDKEKRLQVLKRSLELALQVKDSLQISRAYHDFSFFYDDCDSLDLALAYAQAALKNLPSCKKRNSSYLSIGSFWLQKDQKDSAKYYLEQSLNGSDDIKGQALSYAYLSDLDESLSNYQGAFEYLNKYSEIIDSLFVSDKSSQIEKLGYKYETEARIAKHKAKTVELIILIVSLFTIAILVLVLVMQQINRRRKIAKLIYEQQIQKVNTEIDHLQDRIKDNEAVIIRFREKQREYESEIERKQEEIEEMASQKHALRKNLFYQTSIYSEIKLLAAQDSSDKQHINVLPSSSRKLLEDTIFALYAEYVTDLSTKYSFLTKDDLFFLCLEKAELSTFVIALCFGYADTKSINQRRYRIRLKMA